MYRDDAPDEPANEIDMRFVDENGKTFFVQRGGDQFVDPSWATDVNASLANPAPDEQRVRDFVIAREAAGCSRTRRRRSSSRTLPRVGVRRAPRAVGRSGDDQEGRLDRGEPAGRRGLRHHSWGGSWWFEGDLYDKSTSCVFWYCPAKHSAVAIWAYQTSWQLAVMACNHGSCPGNGTSYECYSTSGAWRTNASISASRTAARRSAAAASRATAGTAAATTTSATTTRPTSCGRSRTAAPGNGGSLDTNGDGYNFVYNGPGTGGDGSWVNYACTCAYNNGCNNDWSRPICP